MKKIKSNAILTSGGDSPGMNAAIRACVRTALAQKMQVWGIKKGYQGLIEKDLFLMNASSVGNTLQKGGTFLQTSRCPEFHQKKYRSLAFKNLQEKNIDGLVVIGGDGSFRGAYQLFQETKFPIVGIPGTIDNDILGTDYTIGFDTAVQTAMEAVDKV
ncbi:MAG: 6-phosphofructokinase, partial [Bacteriovoracaceae bacterium]|nr:6-phosphofructokinase [Bacteriovoracaceae bacterium]